jgi:hypothetical protein
MSGVSTDTFLDIYLNDLAGGRAAVFAGAGLSVPAGFVDWKSLLRPLAEDVGLDIEREPDLIRLTQYAINEAGGRARVNARLINEFTRRAEATRNHELLARLPVSAFWTTNYDGLIEESLSAAGREPAVIHSQEQLTSRSQWANSTVYKIHGDRSRPDQCVLSQDDFENYSDSHGQFIELLRGSLVESTFLFIGYSLSDPNIDHLLSRIRIRFGPDRREHFWITKGVAPDECGTNDEFEYRRGREELRIRDLKRYGIQAVLVDSYSDITDLLEELANRYRRRSVFVSGAAHDYRPLGQHKLENLARGLGERLADQDYTLVSGGGLNVGTAAVLGAVAHANRRGVLTNERVRVTAFDQLIEDDPRARDRQYREYRRQMLESAGFAVFISGNKANGDSVEPASGVRTEFDLAVQSGAIPVAIGASGHVAEELWRRLRADPARYYGDTQVVSELDRMGPGNTDLDGILDAVFSMLHRFDGRRR